MIIFRNLLEFTRRLDCLPLGRKFSPALQSIAAGRELGTSKSGHVSVNGHAPYDSVLLCVRRSCTGQSGELRCVHVVTSPNRLHLPSRSSWDCLRLSSTSYGTTVAPYAMSRWASELTIYLAGNEIQFLRDREAAIRVRATSATEISYWQDVHWRLGAAMVVAVVFFGAGAMVMFPESKSRSSPYLSSCVSCSSDELPRFKVPRITRPLSP